MIKRGLLLIASFVLITVLGVSCGSTKNSVSVSEKEAASVPMEPQDEQSQILLVTGTISYDSVKAVYSITVASQTQIDGTLVSEDASIKDTGKDLNWVQLGQDGSVLSVNGLDNPLVQEMEFHEGNVIKHETVRLKETPFFWRFQLNPLADKVVVRNREKEIITLDVVRK